MAIGVELTEEDFPDPAVTEEAPAWIVHLNRLHDEVLVGQLDEYHVHKNSAHPSNGTFGTHKMPLARKFLTDRLWLATGYGDWAPGPKSEKVHLSDLEALTKRTARLFRAWYHGADQAE